MTELTARVHIQVPDNPDGVWVDVSPPPGQPLTGNDVSALADGEKGSVYLAVVRQVSATAPAGNVNALLQSIDRIEITESDGTNRRTEVVTPNASVLTGLARFFVPGGATSVVSPSPTPTLQRSPDAPPLSLTMLGQTLTLVLAPQQQQLEAGIVFDRYTSNYTDGTGRQATMELRRQHPDGAWQVRGRLGAYTPIPAGMLQPSGPPPTPHTPYDMGTADHVVQIGDPLLSGPQGWYQRACADRADQWLGFHDGNLEHAISGLDPSMSGYNSIPDTQEVTYTVNGVRQTLTIGDIRNGARAILIARRDSQVAGPAAPPPPPPIAQTVVTPELGRDVTLTALSGEGNDAQFQGSGADRMQYFHGPGDHPARYRRAFPEGGTAALQFQKEHPPGSNRWVNVQPNRPVIARPAASGGVSSMDPI